MSDPAPSDGGPVWGARPDWSSGDWLPIVRAKLGYTVRAVAVNELIETVQIHWVDGRTVPHLAGGACPACQDGFTPRLVGYVGGCLPATLRSCLIEFPARCLIEWTRRGGENPPRLRGMEVILRRTQDRPNGRVEFEVHRWRGDAARLPGPVDVRSALLRIWGRS